MRSWMRLIAGLGIGTTLLSGCAAGTSDWACPPVVAYDKGLLERAAGEVEALSEDAALIVLLSDYWVLRAQVRACGGR